MAPTAPISAPRIDLLGGNRYRLAEPYTYEWEHDGALLRLTVPAGTETDLASIPRFAWWFVSPFDLGAAAIHHDWLYAHGGNVVTERWNGTQWDQVTTPWSRRDTDRLFARMMREAGVPVLQRRSAYLTVRMFGQLAWNGGVA